MPASLGREKNGALSISLHLCKTDGFRVSLSFSATLLYCHLSLPYIYSWFEVIVLFGARSYRCPHFFRLEFMDLIPDIITFLFPRHPLFTHLSFLRLSRSAALSTLPPRSSNSSSSPDTCLVPSNLFKIRSRVFGGLPETRLLLSAINQQSRSRKTCWSLCSYFYYFEAGEITLAGVSNILLGGLTVIFNRGGSTGKYRG